MILKTTFNDIRKIEAEHGKEYHIFPGRLSSRTVTGNYDFWEISYRVLYWDDNHIKTIKDLKGLRVLADAIFDRGWVNIIAIEVNVEHLAKECRNFKSYGAFPHGHLVNLGSVCGPLSEKYKFRFNGETK